MRRSVADHRHRQGILARLAEVDGNDWPEGHRSVAALAAVNNQQPTAELRPPEQSQTDEGDLMPYRLLDAIERAAIRDKLSPVKVFEAVRPNSTSTLEQLGNWVERSFSSGAAISGSANATPRRSISTMRTSIPRPGAVSRSSRAASSASWQRCASTSDL